MDSQWIICPAVSSFYWESLSDPINETAKAAGNNEALDIYPITVNILQTKLNVHRGKMFGLWPNRTSHMELIAAGYAGQSDKLVPLSEQTPSQFCGICFQSEKTHKVWFHLERAVGHSLRESPLTGWAAAYKPEPSCCRFSQTDFTLVCVFVCSFLVENKR